MVFLRSARAVLIPNVLLCVMCTLLFGIVAVGVLSAAPANERPSDSRAQGNGELLIAAASDLRFAFEEVAEEFEAQHDVSVTFSFGSSGVLTDQIENGAPFDLFFSANRDYVERIVDGGFAAGDLEVYALGYLALVVPSGDTLPELEELADDSYEAISIANPNHAPYGMAAEEALESSGLYVDVEERLVYGDNVLDAMRLVETGNADAGLVALAFLPGTDGVRGERIDPGLHEPIEQTAVVLQGGENPNAAEAFLELVSSETGREIMREYRFGTPSE